MNSSTYRFTLDIQSRASQVSIPVMLNDTGRSLYISLSDGGEAYHIADGCRAVLFATKADEKTLVNDCIIEHNSNIRYDFTAQTATAEGITNCEIRLYGTDGRLITSPRFIMLVDARVVYDNDVSISANESNAIDAILVSETERVEAEANRVLAEQERAEAESARDTADVARHTAIEEAIANANNAVAEAIEGVNDAVNNAVASADSATVRANSAAELVENLLADKIPYAEEESY